MMTIAIAFIIIALMILFGFFVGLIYGLIEEDMSIKNGEDKNTDKNVEKLRL